MFGDILLITKRADLFKAVKLDLRRLAYDTHLVSYSEAFAIRDELKQHDFGLVIIDAHEHSFAYETLLETLALPAIILHDQFNPIEAIGHVQICSYLHFPCSPVKLCAHILLAFETARQRNLIQNNGVYEARDIFIGISKQAQRIRLDAEKLSGSACRIFLSGPEGSGKRQFAHFIHENSSRKHMRFISFSPQQGESEEEWEALLFGGMTEGLLAQAVDGTFYIDNIEKLTDTLQHRLLCYLVEQDKNKASNTRFITASCMSFERGRDLCGLSAALYDRIAIETIKIPSLRERCTDIGQIVHYFAEKTVQSYKLEPIMITDAVLRVLQVHEWKRNFRQLSAYVEYMLLAADFEGKHEIDIHALSADILAETNIAGAVRHVEQDEVMNLPLREARQFFEREYLSTQISRFSGNVSRMAAFIGMERTALHRKLKILGVADYARTDHYV